MGVVARFYAGHCEVCSVELKSCVSEVSRSLRAVSCLIREGCSYIVLGQVINKARSIVSYRNQDLLKARHDASDK